MRKFVAGVLLTGLIVAGAALLRASSLPSFCPANCCSGPGDCPTPTCCAKK